MRIILLFISVFFFSCWNRNENKSNNSVYEEILPDDGDNYLLGTKNIFFTEKDILPFYYKEWSSYFLKDSIRTQIIPFTEKQQKFPLKGEKYFYTMDSDGFYKVSKWDIKDFSFELILYNIFGENDRQNLVTQINSYRGQELIDALILDMRLDFEIRVYSDFQIKNDSIFIKRYEINNTLYNDNGDIIGKKENDTLITKEVYLIYKDGKFIKLN